MIGYLLILLLKSEYLLTFFISGYRQMPDVGGFELNELCLLKQNRYVEKNILSRY